MNQRIARRLVIGAAIGAGLAGTGLAWRQIQKQENTISPLKQITALTPSGQLLRLDGFTGRPLLLNFWATWCPPCVKELPLLNEFFAQNRDRWHVLALAADQANAVEKFMQRVPLDLTVGIMGMDALNLARELGNDRGGLPFTAVFDKRGMVAQRKIGEITSSDLDAWAKAFS